MSRLRRPVRVLLVAVFLPVPLLAGLIAAGITGPRDARQTGPSRPAAASERAYTPPGGERLDVGDGAGGAVIFRPRDGAAAPGAVVVLVPAWDAVDPSDYGPWIGHLVRRGVTVIHPTYARAAAPGGAGPLSDLLAGVGAALRHARPAPGRLVVAGDDVGGALAADFAASARARGLPAPAAVLSIYPARTPRPIAAPVPSADLAAIAEGTRVRVLLAEREGAAGRRAARRIAAGAAHARVSLELVRADAVEDRDAPRRTDVVARRTFWRPLDALVAATGRRERGREGP